MTKQSDADVAGPSSPCAFDHRDDRSPQENPSLSMDPVSMNDCVETQAEPTHVVN